MKRGRQQFTTDDYAYFTQQRKRRRRRRIMRVVGLLIILVVLFGGGLTLLSGRVDLSGIVPTVAVLLNAEDMTTEVVVIGTPRPPTAIPTILASTLTNPTVTPPPSTPVPNSNPNLYPPNIVALQEEMLRLINADRAQNQLAPVQWDEMLALAGQLHSEEMVEHNYLSHWNLAGLGPDHRYSRFGGQHISRENAHSFSYVFDDERGAPIDDWSAVIQNAQEGLMNSPGHRANILAPSHTHVGIGMAYNAATGQFRLAQEFGNQSVQLAQPIPVEVRVGEMVEVIGRITATGLSNILFSVAYEPFPPVLSVAQLRQTGTYRSKADSIDVRRVGESFTESITFDFSEGSGVYHIRLFADRAGTQFQLLNHAVWVER